MNTEYLASPKKYYFRIMPTVILEGVPSLVLLSFFVAALIIAYSSMITVLLGFVSLLAISNTRKRLKWYEVFITKIKFNGNRIYIHSVLRNEIQPCVSFDIEHTNISFSARGAGAPHIFLNFISDHHRIRQVNIGNWTTQCFVEIFKKFKELKGEKITYDEQDWIDRLSK